MCGLNAYRLNWQRMMLFLQPSPDYNMFVAYIDNMLLLVGVVA